MALLVKTSIKPISRSRYATSINHWENFLTTTGTQYSDGGKILPSALCHFAAFRFAYSTNIGSTIAQELTGVGHWAKLRGLNMPALHERALLQQVIKGIKNNRPSEQKDMNMSVSLLEEIITNLPSLSLGPCEQRLRASVFSMAFFAMMRIQDYSEHPEDEGFPDRVQDMELSSLQFHPSHDNATSASFFLPVTKTLRSGAGVAFPCLCPMQCCAVHCLLAYLAYRPTKSPLLITDSTGSALASKTIRKWLQVSLTALKKPKTFVKPQDFRKGGATFYASLGFPTHDIEKWGRWATNSKTLKQTYLRFDFRTYWSAPI